MDNVAIDFSKYDDRSLLELFWGMVEDGRLNVGVAYVQDPETKFLTHNYLIVSSGELSITSAPDELENPLSIVTTEKTVH